MDAEFEDLLTEISVLKSPTPVQTATKFQEPNKVLAAELTRPPGAARSRAD